MLISCVAYQDGKRLGDIAKHEISDYVARPDCFVWVALHDPDVTELDEMKQEFGLHELAVEDAHHGHQRPKIDEYGDSLFVVLHLIELVGKELRLGEIDIFVGRNYILSVRSHAERGFANVRLRVEREPELLRHGSGYVLYALMDTAVDRYFPVLDAIETELDEIERQIFNGKSARANIEALYGLKQKLMTLKHAVAPLLEAVGKLYGGRVPQRCVGMGDYFRDVYDHLIRLNQGIDSIRDMVITALSVNLSIITLSENEVTKRLAGYGALVAVPTMIAGVYGMNFKFMPELESVYGYPLTLAVMIGIDVYLYYRLRKSGWL